MGAQVTRDAVGLSPELFQLRQINLLEIADLFNSASRQIHLGCCEDGVRQLVEQCSDLGIGCIE